MSYFVRRAEQQLELAQRADHAQVVHAHYELANLYLDIAYADQAVGQPEPVATAA